MSRDMYLSMSASAKKSVQLFYISTPLNVPGDQCFCGECIGIRSAGNIVPLLLFDWCRRRVARGGGTISKPNCPPASQTKWKLTHVASKVAECLLLPSGMHTKKLERYREGVFSSSQLFYCLVMTCFVLDDIFSLCLCPKLCPKLPQIRTAKHITHHVLRVTRHA